MGTVFTIMFVLVAVLGGPSAAYFVIGLLRYRISGGDSGAVSAAKNTIVYSVLGAGGAATLGLLMLVLWPALVRSWTPSSVLVLVSTVLSLMPFVVAGLAAASVSARRALLVGLRRAIRLAALLMPADERDKWAELHVAMLRQAQRRERRGQLWPLASNILFLSPVSALNRHRARMYLHRAIATSKSHP